jgi:hypothetical protein
VKPLYILPRIWCRTAFSTEHPWGAAIAREETIKRYGQALRRESDARTMRNCLGSWLPYAGSRVRPQRSGILLLCKVRSTISGSNRP